MEPVQSANEMSQGLPVCRQCGHHYTEAFSGSWTALQMLVMTLGLPSASERCRWWVKTMSECHQHFRPQPESCPRVCVPGLNSVWQLALNNIQQPLPWTWDWESCHYSLQSDKKSLSTPKSRCKWPVYWVPYSIEASCRLHSTLERRLNYFWCAALGIFWGDGETKCPTTQCLRGQGPPPCALYSSLCWLGHVFHMEGSRIHKDLLYGELATGKWPTGRLQMHFKDICKHDLKVLAVNADTWEVPVSNRWVWRQQVQRGFQCIKTPWHSRQRKR